MIIEIKDLEYPIRFLISSNLSTQNINFTPLVSSQIDLTENQTNYRWGGPLIAAIHQMLDPAPLGCRNLNLIPKL